MKNFLEKIISLDCICQWAERDSITKESVSQHSFKVAAIASYLLKHHAKLNGNLYKPKFTQFCYEVMDYAVMHDFDEALIGRDISHIVKYNKYNGDKIREVLDDFVEHSYEELFGEKMKHPSPRVKTFVKLCDWIALFTFVERNRQMGSKEFEQERGYCLSNIVSKLEETRKMFKEEFEIDFTLNNELWKC